MASDRATELRALAQRVADALSAREVVVTGSVSRGVADGWSDVELLVPAALPSLDTAERTASAASIEVSTRFASDEIVYVAGSREGTMVELLWADPVAIDGLIEMAFAGGLVDHSRLRALEALEHGVALRGGALLAGWQGRLRSYPEALRDRLIRDAVADWGGYPVNAYLRQAYRDDRYSLVKVVLGVTEDVLRLLFAVNRRWEPSWKRVPELLAELELVPADAAARIETALSEPEPRRALLTAFELASDATALAGTGVDAARAWLGEAVAALR